MSSSSTGPSLADEHSQTWLDQEQWYHYQPNVPFALVATVVFGILAIILAMQTFRSRQWFTIILSLGAFAEFAGYLTRYFVTQGAGKDVFIVSYVLILVTPNAFALVNYAAVGRLLPSLPTQPGPKTWLRIPIITDEYGVFRAGRIATFFFLSDVVAFMIQASAAAFLTSSDPSTISKGQTVIEIGLAWGLAFIGLFFFVTCFVYLSKTYTIKNHPDLALIKRMYVSLFITITLLLIRSVYRMVEFVQGTTGYVASHESFFGVFDTGLMILACVFYSMFHYGHYLNQIHFPAMVDYANKQPSPLPGQAGEMELMGQVVQVAPAEGEDQVVMVHGSDE
jgi:hypothetical protein